MLSLTLPEVRFISRSIVVILLAGLGLGCSLMKNLERPKYPPPKIGPRQKVYYFEFDKVWRATQIALQHYPMRINNMDKGILETEILKGGQAWNPPHNPGQIRGGKRYHLKLRVVKGKVQGRSAIKVVIKKDIEHQSDFFADTKKLPSDGLEERVLLYRIKRELEIDRALQRALKRQQVQ